jgi:DNA-binding CsgD family transcriptional regulator
MQPRDRLNAREIQVATLVWQGLTNKDIAAVLLTSEQVVKNYLRTTFDKLGVWTRLELALYVASHGGANWQTQTRTLAEGALPVWRRRSGEEASPPGEAAEASAPANDAARVLARGVGSGPG